MGASLSTLWRFLGFRPKLEVIMLGKDAVGKTTILYQLKMGSVIETIPTIGFNVETVTHRSVNLTVWDIGGGDKIPPLWSNYFDRHGHQQSLVFVVDSTDRNRIDEVSELLHSLLHKVSQLQQLLVLANKQDCADAMNLEEINARLHLERVDPSLRWTVLGCCALNGQGLTEAMDWLVEGI